MNARQRRRGRRAIQRLVRNRATVAFRGWDGVLWRGVVVDADRLHRPGALPMLRIKTPSRLSPINLARPPATVLKVRSGRFVVPETEWRRPLGALVGRG